MAPPLVFARFLGQVDGELAYRNIGFVIEPRCSAPSSIPIHDVQSRGSKQSDQGFHI